VEGIGAEVKRVRCDEIVMKIPQSLGLIELSKQAAKWSEREGKIRNEMRKDEVPTITQRFV
jgi:hypothetical protein